MVAERAFDVAGFDAFPVVEARQDGVDDLLGFVFAEVFVEAVEEVLARERVVDLGLLVVIL